MAIPVLRQFKRLLVAGLLGTALATSPAIADNFDEAIDLFQNGRQPEAVKMLQDLTNQHDARATYVLGLLYLNGISVRTDQELGLRLITESAGQYNNARAQNYLGSLYYEGRLVQQDFKTAFHWYEKAAHQEDPDAEYNLSVLYAYGDGVE